MRGKSEEVYQNALNVRVVSDRIIPGTLATFSLMNMPISTSGSIQIFIRRS
jgi:hypothetical protein